MRGRFTLSFLATIALGTTALACGSDAADGFECSEKSIENGTTTVCGHFGTTTITSYTCLPPGALTIRMLTPNADEAPCPPGTVAVPGSSSDAPGTTDYPVVPGFPGSPSADGSSGSPPGSSSSGGPAGSSVGDGPTDGYVCNDHGGTTECVHTTCSGGYVLKHGACVPKGNNGVGNGVDPQPPGNPPVNDGPGTSPGDPGNRK